LSSENLRLKSWLNGNPSAKNTPYIKATTIGIPNNNTRESVINNSFVS